MLSQRKMSDKKEPKDEASEQSSLKNDSKAIDIPQNRFPFSLVWGSLPCITWLIPFIGHMGICDSQGRIHDFAGPYTVNTDDFMVGNVAKYYQMDVESTVTSKAQVEGKTPQQVWDNAIEESDGHFVQTMHNLCCNNCHHHCAHALSLMGEPCSMLKAWSLVTFKGRYVSCGRLFCTYLPFLILVGIIIVIVLFTR
eukprot:TRINITY_DN1635_c0_g1_i2.p1 TRINITY_DN1635_c0_g1~~TRINITY_DN1635_c0_g1_i2.p1  ORF type:complete len:196 (+),score=37.02 TRINITY_DN1635_c0_g1_i2:96-683(+)